MLMSSHSASDKFGFTSWLWPSVILGQLSPLLGLSFPSPKQTGCSGCQVRGLLGEQLLSQESSLIHRCVWTRTTGVGRAGCWGGGTAYQFTAPRSGMQPGYSLPSEPCCYWLLKGYGCRRNSLILFPLAAEHSAYRRAWPEAGTVSRHLDSLTWPWHKGSLSVRRRAGSRRRRWRGPSVAARDMGVGSTS